MKKSILILVMLFVASLSMKAQYGGVINAVNNSNVLGQIRRNANALMTYDSTSIVKLDSVKAHLPMSNGKLAIDSITIKSMPTFSVTASFDSTLSRSATKIINGTGSSAVNIQDGGNSLTVDGTVSVSGHDSTTDSRIGVKLIQNPTIAGFASTPTVNIGTGMYAVLASDSTKYRITHKISELPLLPAFATTPTFNIGTGGYSVSAADSTKYRITHKISESALPTGAATESTLSTLNGKVPTGLTTSGNRLAIYSPDSIRVFATNGFGSGGGGGGDASAANQVVGNALLQGIKTLDSTINNKLNDSIRVFATNGFGSGGGGGDSTTNSRIGVKLIQNPTIANTSFGISGSLPAFASTPTVNIGTTGTIPVSGTFWQATQPVSLSSVPSHAVTNAGTFAVQVDSSTQRQSFKIKELPSLATGSNAIGSITNTSFGISGTLPAFATTPTFNIGTGGYAVSASDSTKYRISMKVQESALPNGAATSSLQTSGNTSLTDISIYTSNISNWADNNSIPAGASTGGGSPNAGFLSYGVASTTSPSFTNAGTYPLSLSLNGNLRVNDTLVQQRIPTGLTVNSNRLAIYSPDSIRVFATNGFGSGGGGGGTQYAELSTTSPATGTVALGRYMSTPPTLTNGQLYAPMLNSRGTILADVTSSVPNIASPASVPTSGYEVYGLVSTVSPSPANNRNAQLSLTDKGGLRTTLVDLSGNYVDASGGGGGGGATAVYDTVGSATSMTVTNLNSLANSATVGWQSDRIDNITSTKATDYRVFVKCTMANTVPGNDKQIYVYAAPFYYDGSTWQGASLGTTSQATGTQGSCTIASAAPNNLILLGVLSYSTQNMVLQSSFNLSNAFGRTLPDGFSIVLINFTGASVSASGNVVSYKPVYQTNR